MAGILTATAAQVQTARDACYKAHKLLQDISQGPLPTSTKLNSAQVAAFDAVLSAAKVALGVVAI